MNYIQKIILVLVLLTGYHLRGTAQDSVKVKVNLEKTIEAMSPIWAWFGYDEPNYTYMKDGKKLLTDISRLSPVPVYVRAHNLLTTGDGTPAFKWGSTNIYTEDKKGHPIYNYAIVDSIFDTYIQRGMHPLVQIGFMPEALSTRPKPYKHHWKPGDPYNDIYTGWAYPPKDYNKWSELIYQWARHCKERYGEKEVSQWYWEVWNEPVDYFKGSFEEYCKLYDYAVDGLLKALPDAVVGGPHTASPVWERDYAFLKNFLEHCLHGKNYATGKTGSPLRYIGFHSKGGPDFKSGKVLMDIGIQLRGVQKGFELIASYPELKRLPVIIGEFDPEGCAACSSEFLPQYNYRNGTMYSSTVADSYARLYELARKYNINLKGAVTWAFEFENQPWFAGFRDLATNGINKPVLNVFRMFGQMGGNLVQASSSGMLALDSICKNSVRATPDVGVLASKSTHSAAIMIWNYHDLNNVNVSVAPIDLQIEGCKTTGKILVTHYRVDNTYSNSFAEWLKMGGPQTPDEAQLKILKRSGELQQFCSPKWVNVIGGKIRLDFDLPRQGVSLVTLEW